MASGSSAAAVIAILVLLMCVFCTAGLGEPHDTGACDPFEVHIALTGDPTQMRVVWRTNSSGCAQVVRYGPASMRSEAPALASMAHSSSSSYNSGLLCGPPGNSARYTLHLYTAVLAGLLPGESYSYRIGNSGAVQTFRAQLPAGDRSAFGFLVYGDMGADRHRYGNRGAKSTTKAVAREVREESAQLILHAGDISYADGRADAWNAFMHQMEPIASSVPYMIAVGNHEYGATNGTDRDYWNETVFRPHWKDFEDKAGGECGLPTVWRYIMPKSTVVVQRYPLIEDTFPHRKQLAGSRIAENAESFPPFWYSFEYGKVHFTVISTEHDLGHGSEQHSWLAADLAATDRCRTPWLLVFMHRPLYVPKPNHDNRNVAKHLRRRVERLFLDNKVTAVVSGHVHVYTRSCSVFNNTCADEQANGVPYMIVGTAGHKIGSVTPSSDTRWLADFQLEYGYGKFTVPEEGDLLFQFISAGNASVLDSVHLTQRGECREPVSLAVT